MDDLISRQAAIDAYGDWYVEEGTAEGFIGTVKQLLEGLPSAQPIQTASNYLQSLPTSPLLVGKMPSAQPEQAVKGCRNCKYGKYNDHWKTRFCYNPNECTEWNLWEPSDQSDNKLYKIAELVEGTIDHFDLDDAMDLLYQIKEIVGNETSNI